MTTEALLAYAHLLAIFTLIVFIASEAALCRPEWMNAAIVERLATIDRVYGIAALAVLATGLVRIYLGSKGSGWYWGNWLLYAKIGAFVVVGLVSIAPTLAFARWRKALRGTGDLPTGAEVRRVRKLVMLQAHIIPLIPLAAVFLARGFGGALTSGRRDSRISGQPDSRTAGQPDAEDAKDTQRTRKETQRLVVCL